MLSPCLYQPLLRRCDFSGKVAKPVALSYSSNFLLLGSCSLSPMPMFGLLALSITQSVFQGLAHSWMCSSPLQPHQILMLCRTWLLFSLFFSFLSYFLRSALFHWSQWAVFWVEVKCSMISSSFPGTWYWTYTVYSVFPSAFSTFSFSFSALNAWKSSVLASAALNVRNSRKK